MSTNFYADHHVCPHCGMTGRERVHLGKRTAGGDGEHLTTNTEEQPHGS